MPAPATDPARALGAGVLYFLPTFAVGFVLGIARTLLLQSAPDIGRMTAMLVEAPLILAASWIICAIVVRRLAVPADIATRLVMGASAFACLMAAEMAMSVLMAGRTPAEHLALYAEPSYAVGLVAQIGFALIPLLQRRAP